MNSEHWTLLEPDNRTPVGTIVVEGNLNSDDFGRLFTFQIHSGNLWHAWFDQEPLLAETARGSLHPARIAAFPAGRGATGLLQIE